MDDQLTKPTRGAPRLWRRFIVMLRTANFFAWLEAVAALSFVAMVAVTYVAFSSAPADGRLLPSTQIASLLIGTMIPALTLVVLIGRRLAIRRAAGSTARMHVRLVFFFSLIAAIPTLCMEATPETVRRAFRAVDSKATQLWLNASLGKTLTARRNEAYRESKANPCDHAFSTT